MMKKENIYNNLVVNSLTSAHSLQQKNLALELKISLFRDLILLRASNILLGTEESQKENADNIEKMHDILLDLNHQLENILKSITL